MTINKENNKSKVKNTQKKGSGPLALSTKRNDKKDLSIYREQNLIKNY